MPFTSVTPDTGFSPVPIQPVDFNPTPKPLEPDSALRDLSTAAGIVSLNPGALVNTIAQRNDEITAAFRLDNTVYNAWELLSKPTFQPDPSFDLRGQLVKDKLWDTMRDKFLNVHSKAEYDFIVGRINREQNDRATIERAGITGTLLSMTAGVLDPLMFVPFLGEGKGVAVILKNALLAGTSAAAQEVVLQANQETRTFQESAAGIAGATILGGLIGGAAVYLRGAPERGVQKALAEHMARINEGDMAASTPDATILTSRISTLEKELETAKAAEPVVNPEVVADAGVAPPATRSVEAIQQELDAVKAEYETHLANTEIDAALKSSVGSNSAVGADIATRGAGGLKGMLGIGERIAKIAGPVTANLAQRVSKEIQRVTAELSTAGLRLEGNLIIDKEGKVFGSIPSNQGGTVESVIGSRRAEVLNLIRQAQENHADYFFGKGEAAGPLRATRAGMQSSFTRKTSFGPSAAKMNRRQFMQAVGEAMFAGDVHPIPEVQKTAQQFRKYYDQLFQEAQDLGVIRDLPPEGQRDLSFLNRLYNKDAIRKQPQRFLELLANHMDEVLQDDFTRTFTTFTRRQARDSERLTIMDMPQEQAESMRVALKDELKALDSAENDDYGPMEDLIKLWRGEAVKLSKKIKELTAKLDGMSLKEERAAKVELGRLSSQRQSYRDEVARLSADPGVEARAQRRAEIKHLLRVLNKSEYFMDKKYRQKFAAMEKIEEDSIDTIQRAIRSGSKALSEIDAVSEKSAEAIDRARQSIEQATDKWVAYNNRITAIQEKAGAQADAGIESTDNEYERALARLLDLQGKRDAALQRMLDARDNLQTLGNIDRVEGGVADARAAIKEAMDVMVEKAVDLNARRAQRAAKLEADLKKFDAQAFAARRAEVVERMKAREAKTLDYVHELGAKDARGALATGKADFKDRAYELAAATKERILGTHIRLAGFDAMADKRGTELIRTLTIASEKLTPYGFLENDAERLLHAYAHTLVPDIEITRRLGPLTEAENGSIALWAKQIDEEKTRVLANLKDSMEREAAAAKKPLDEAKLQELSRQIEDEFQVGLNNLDAIIRRLRGTYGIPSDPDSFTTRAIQAVTASQVMRVLGGVVPSSFADIARPMLKYGLSRTLMNAWLPMVSNWKAIKMTMEEAQRAFVAIETLTANNIHMLIDLMGSTGKNSKFEQTLLWGASKMGIIAGYSPWTDLMKTLSTMSASSKILDSLDAALNKTGSVRFQKEATEFLASLGWDETLQKKIFAEINAGGGEKVGGTWVPQTERWQSKEAVRAFRAALYHEASASIITPGVELPTWANKSQWHKLLFSLKSFAFASVPKTLMAGLQQRDMAALNGVLMALALGGLSVYTKATVAGIDPFTEYTQNEFLNRAIDQSGLLGALWIVQQFASDATAGPATGDWEAARWLEAARSFLGMHQINDPASAMLNDAFGPNFSLASLITQTIASGSLTPGQIHRIRQLLPFQNLVYLRWLFDHLEGSAAEAINAE